MVEQTTRTHPAEAAPPADNVPAEANVPALDRHDPAFAQAVANAKLATEQIRNPVPPARGKLYRISTERQGAYYELVGPDGEHLQFFDDMGNVVQEAKPFAGADVDRTVIYEDIALADRERKIWIENAITRDKGFKYPGHADTHSHQH